LIAAICGLIAITVYILYLVDRLLSKIDTLETKLSRIQPQGMKREELDAVLRSIATSFQDQLGKVNEILVSTGKDIDSINARIAVHAKNLDLIAGKLDNLEKSLVGGSKETTALRRDVAVVTEKLEQLEKETNLLANMQALTGEF
jgi:uncharacterized coiled-coil DUF342 family protein